MKSAIEDSFPIVEINRLTMPERNAFKPVFQMHKWFARRASCVFRAILLGALKPLPLDKDGKPTKSGAQVIMDEFYKDHTHDPDTNGKVILDPFMGGGTTIVEAMRLGCNVIGVDLNPVAWFVVKTETDPIDMVELRAAFHRLSERKVDWSGKPLRETLLNLYKTNCPSCGSEADIIYTFWVKSAICTDNNCRKQVPLFGDYIVAQKTPSIRYFSDCNCPECGKTFDWDIEPAAIVGDLKLMVNAGKYSAGLGRTSARWTYGRADKAPNGGIAGKVDCPWCNKNVTPQNQHAKTKRKKVELTAIFCPKCETVWQYRGPLSDKMECPLCRHIYDPQFGHVPDTGAYLCDCGNRAKIIDSIRSLPQEQLLPMRPYAIEARCPSCDLQPEKNCDEEETDLFARIRVTPISDDLPANKPNRDSILWKNKGLFFKAVDSSDLARYQEASNIWDRCCGVLPYPTSAVPAGYNTNQMVKHNYLYWHQMFNSRQLLSMATILDAIMVETNKFCREMLLCAFSATLERNNMFCRYFNDRNTIQANFDRHDFAPKLTPAENSPFQDATIRGSFPNMFERLFDGKNYCLHPYDNDREKPDSRTRLSSESVYTGTSSLFCGDSREVLNQHVTSINISITDPPYAGNVNYSELSDFFFVWLRLALKDTYSHFMPEYVPKVNEIVENSTRNKSREDFQQGLQDVFVKVHTKLPSDGIFVFTFHHAETTAWESVLQALADAGFSLTAAYPVHGEKESSLMLMDSTAISYDLIHVCKPIVKEPGQRSWPGIRQKIRERARAEIKLIEEGRFGGQSLPPADRNIILIGKCLELYSAHYGKVVDHEGNPVSLHAALEEIKMMVDQLTTEESALPPELEEVDATSYVYLTCLADRREIKSDEVHKATRGISDPSSLIGRDLMIKGRAKRGRTYEVKSPVERLEILKKKFGVRQSDKQGTLFEEDLSVLAVPGVIFIDYVHFLIGLAETGESVLEWLESPEFRGKRPQIRAALEYLAKRNRSFVEPIRKIMGLIDEKTLFSIKEVDHA